MLSIFALLCNRPDNFISQNWTSIPIEHFCPFSFSPIYFSFYDFDDFKCFIWVEKYFIQYFSFCDWLILLSIMFLRSTHTVAYARIPSFLRLHDIPLYAYTTLGFICSSVSGRLGCSHSLATVNNATVNMGVQILSWDPAVKSFG